GIRDADMTGVQTCALPIWLYAWHPGIGWEGWYSFLWMPGLLLVTWPATRGATIAGIAAVAGSAAALLTWGAMTESRLESAQQDRSEERRGGKEGRSRGRGG